MINELIEVKSQIKGAIEDKGVVVDVGMIDYDEKIRSIESLPTYIVPDGVKFGYSMMTNFDGSIYQTYLLSDMGGMFAICEELVSVDNIDTSNATNMSHMFDQCRSLQSYPVLNTSNVTDMSYMFTACHSLSSVHYMDTSNVTNMSHMFNYASITSIPEFDMSNVIDASFMLSSSGVSKFNLNTSNVINAERMFSSSSIEDVELDITNMESMNSIFRNCNNLKKVKLKGQPMEDCDVSDMFTWDTTPSPGGPERVFYYDSRYDYSKILNEVPTAIPELKWSIIPY